MREVGISILEGLVCVSTGGTDSGFESAMEICRSVYPSLRNTAAFCLLLGPTVLFSMQCHEYMK